VEALRAVTQHLEVVGRQLVPVERVLCDAAKGGRAFEVERRAAAKGCLLAHAPSNAGRVNESPVAPGRRDRRGQDQGHGQTPVVGRVRWYRRRPRGKLGRFTAQGTGPGIFSKLHLTCLSSRGR